MRLFTKKPTDLPRRRQFDATMSPARQRDDHSSSIAAGGELFRRNRTLTGSASSSVKSAANESDSHLKSPRVYAHELHEHRRRIGGTLLIVLVLVAFLMTLLWQFTAQVSISTPGLNRAIDSAKYIQAVQDYYGQHPFERFRFAVNDQRLTDFVHRRLPEVQTARIARGATFASATVVVAMRQPVAGWQMGSTQYYVDNEGVPFTENYYTPPVVQIIDQSGVPVSSGQAIASNRFLSYVGRTVAAVSMQKLAVRQVVIPVATTRQLELHLQNVSYPVKFVIDRPVGEQVEDMTRAIAYFKAKGITPQYVDVRVSGKAFYK